MKLVLTVPFGEAESQPNANAGCNGKRNHGHDEPECLFPQAAHPWGVLPVLDWFLCIISVWGLLLLLVLLLLVVLL